MKPVVLQAALLTQGELQLSRGRAREAVATFGRVLEDHRDSKLIARARYGKARAHRRLGEFDQAQTLLINTPAAGLLRAMVTMELGRGYLDRGDNRNAAGHFMRVAILYEPQEAGGPVALCAEALLLAARSYARLDKREVAMARFDELIAHPLYKDTKFARTAASRRRKWARKWGLSSKGEKGRSPAAGSEEKGR
jgi:tetratricopeptide (TPR) repeat protein